MAEEKERKTYPTIPQGAWWTLRKKFKQSIPGVVTDSYLSTVLNMQAVSARANVLPGLKQVGLIDEDGKTGDRAAKWRDDQSYKAVCEEMIADVYPEELAHAVPDPSRDREGAERWFANKTRAGENAANKMTALYALLVEADPSKQPDDKEKKERPPRKAVVPTPPVHAAVAPAPPLAPKPVGGDDRQPQRQKAPDININLQVHISADSTADQIDQIFASMAKHIYKRD